MIVVRCTTKLLDRLPEQSDPRGVRSTSTLGDWYATLIRTRRGHFVLAMAREALLPVVVTGRDVRTFPDRLAEQTGAMLESYGVPAESVAREREAMRDVHGRSPTPLRFLGWTADGRAVLHEAHLQPAAPTTVPELSLVRGGCWVHFATGSLGHRRTISRVFAIGPKSCITNGHDLGIHDARIVDMHASPDGRSVAVTVNVTTLSLDSYASFLQTVIVATTSG